MKPTVLSMALTAAAAATLAGAVTAAEAARSAGGGSAAGRLEMRKAPHVLVLDSRSALAQGDAPHQIVVTSRAVDGEDPSMQVEVLGLEPGQEAETIDVGGLEVGETRTVTTRQGREIVVTRGEHGVTLSLDGKEIELPSILNMSVIDAEPGHAHVTAFAAGEPGFVSEIENVMVVGADPKVVVGTPLAFGRHLEHLEKLETLKDLDPEVRDKVLAALQEIFAGQPGHGFAFTTKLAQPGEDGAPAVSGHRVMVRRVVVDDDEDATDTGSSKME